VPLGSIDNVFEHAWLPSLCLDTLCSIALQFVRDALSHLFARRCIVFVPGSRVAYSLGR